MKSKKILMVLAFLPVFAWLAHDNNKAMQTCMERYTEEYCRNVLR